MKKIALISALVAGSVMHIAQAADGVINFTGTITDTACTVDVASASQSVQLDTVSQTAFGTTAGSTAAPKKFDIVLKDCPAALPNATVRFDGPTHSGNSSILALSAGQTASNVGIALYEVDSTTLIPVGASSQQVTLDTSASAVNTLSFIAKYMSTAATVGAGSANASTAFTVTYK